MGWVMRLLPFPSNGLFFKKCQCGFPFMTDDKTDNLRAALALHPMSLQQAHAKKCQDAVLYTL
jgi:hypothetical protein